MKRTAVALALMMMGSAAHAGAFDDFMKSLQDQGYTVNEVKNGLTSIKAEVELNGVKQEIVYNKLTGEVVTDGSNDSSSSDSTDDSSDDTGDDNGSSGNSGVSGGDDSGGSSGGDSGGGDSGGSGGGSGGGGMTDAGFQASDYLFAGTKKDIWQ